MKRKKNMKKLLTIMLAGLSLISCTGGGSRSGNVTSPATAGNPTTEPSAVVTQSAVPVNAGPTPAPAPVITAPEISQTGKAIAGMVFVVGGTFSMGSNDTEASGDEKPVHSVILSSFYTGKYEVTQKEYQEIIGDNPSVNPGDNLPVEKVSWFDAIKYCNGKSKKESLAPAYNETTGDLLDSAGNITADVTKAAGYRLLTEAEWEYAAKGGTQSQGFKYAGSNNAPEVSVFRIGSTAPVGSKKPNELGIYDMSGNVWEWTTDWYKPYQKDNAVNPYVSQKSSFRVGRGGSWGDDAPILERVSDRSFDTPNLKNQYLGFRLARNL
jgi:sulfatase modifying factor 1